MCDLNAKGFFDQLRQLSSNIRANTDTLRARIEAAPKTDYSSTAVVQLQDIKKEIKTLKREAENMLSGCQTKTGSFSALLDACEAVVESQSTATVAVESFIKQYGYTTWDELKLKEGGNQKPVNTVETVSDRDATPSPEMTREASNLPTPETKPSRAGKGTPKLEDFGLSEYTLRHQAAWTEKDLKMATNMSLVQADKQMYKGTTQPVTKDSVSATFPVGTPLCVRGKPTCATPRLEDSGFSDHTMQLLKAIKTRTDVKPVSETPQALRHSSDLSCETPQLSIPPMFINDGVIVTPSLGNGEPLPTETPDYHLGGAYGFETEENPYHPGLRGETRTRRLGMEKTSMKLEDQFDMPEPTSLPQGPSRRGEPQCEVLVQPTLLHHTNRPTPPEPELLSSRLKRLQTTSGWTNEDETPPEPELLTVRLNAAQAGQPVNLMSTKLAGEQTSPDTLSARLTRQKEEYSQIKLKAQLTKDKTVASLPKPRDERVYPISAMPASPKLLCRYDFMDNENVPP